MSHIAGWSPSTRPTKRDSLRTWLRAKLKHDRGVEQLEARRAHNPKVAGSSPAPATSSKEESPSAMMGILLCSLSGGKQQYPAPTRTPSCSRVITHFGIVPKSNRGDTMKGLTTTKATYRDNEIAVYSVRFGSDRVFCCSSSFVGQRTEDKWFRTQGEALANERREIDAKLGIVPSPEVRRYGRSR